MKVKEVSKNFITIFVLLALTLSSLASAPIKGEAAPGFPILKSSKDTRPGVVGGPLPGNQPVESLSAWALYTRVIDGYIAPPMVGPGEWDDAAKLDFTLEYIQDGEQHNVTLYVKKTITLTFTLLWWCGVRSMTRVTAFILTSIMTTTGLK